MSEKQRALVTGATGLLGRQVLRAFEDAGYDVAGIGYSRASPPQIQKVDIQDPEAVSQLFDEVKIVSRPALGAADRQPDSCTQNPAAARKLNVTATSTLARLCAEHKSFLIYLSTDYVFPGRPGEAPYAASATPSPPNIYGETKFEGEKEVLASTFNSSQAEDNGKIIKTNTRINGPVVLRVPVLYGETDPKENNKESAVNVIMDALWKANQKIPTEPDNSQDQEERQRNKTKMDDWAIRYPTNTSDVARVCVDIAKLYQSHNPALPQILQFSSEDRMTKYEIMTKFAEVMGLSMQNVIADKDGGKPGPDGTLRPYDCHLSTKELQDLGIDVHTVDFVAWWRRYVGAFRR